MPSQLYVSEVRNPYQRHIIPQYLAVAIASRTIHLGDQTVLQWIPYGMAVERGASGNLSAIAAGQTLPPALQKHF